MPVMRFKAGGAVMLDSIQGFTMSIHNTNWRVRATYGLRLGRMKN